MPYPKEVIEKADELLRQGYSNPEVARMLGIPRPATISEWRRKYGLGLKDGEVVLPEKLRRENLRIWRKVQKRALDALSKTEFKHAEGAVKALEIAFRFIQILAPKRKEIPDRKDTETRVLEVLRDIKRPD